MGLLEDFEENPLETAEQLIESGADLDAIIGKNTTALHVAARLGDIETINLLVSHGAQVNRLDGVGWTPLRYAIGSRKIEVIKALIELGADVNLSDKNGITALHRAVDIENTEIVKVLMDGGADPNSKCNFGKSAVSRAIKLINYPLLLDFIVANADFANEPNGPELASDIAFVMGRNDDIKKIIASNTGLGWLASTLAADPEKIRSIRFDKVDPDNRLRAMLTVAMGEDIIEYLN